MDYRDNRQRWAEAHQVVHFYAGQWCTFTPALTFGLLKLKRHVDHPQQTTIGSGLIAIMIGVSLIAAPAVFNALGDTFGLSGGSHTVIKPRL